MERLHHIGMVVKNIDVTIEFYRDNLGFKLEDRWINPRNGAKIALLESEGLVCEIIEYQRNPFDGMGVYNHMAVTVEDVRLKLEEFKEKGICLRDHTPRQVMAGKGEIVFCCGPDGEMIELYQRMDKTKEGERNENSHTGGPAY